MRSLLSTKVVVACQASLGLEGATRASCAKEGRSMHKESETGPGLSDEYLAFVHQAIRVYEKSGEPFERARLVSAMGKTHAPRLLEEVERLRAENAQLRIALLPLAHVLLDTDRPSEADLAAAFADPEAVDRLRAALENLDLE